MVEEEYGLFIVCVKNTFQVIGLMLENNSRESRYGIAFRLESEFVIVIDHNHGGAEYGISHVRNRETSFPSVFLVRRIVGNGGVGIKFKRLSRFVKSLNGNKLFGYSDLRGGNAYSCIRSVEYRT